MLLVLTRPAGIAHARPNNNLFLSAVARYFAAQSPPPRAHVRLLISGPTRWCVNRNRCLLNPAVPKCFRVSWTPQTGTVLAWWGYGTGMVPTWYHRNTPQALLYCPVLGQRPLFSTIVNP